MDEQQTPVKIIEIWSCKAKHCPAVFETDRDTFIVQGKVLRNVDRSVVTPGPDEDAVEIPADLLNDVVMAMLRSKRQK
jgi:hypothetical protein